jgi:hypothetical protein
MHADDQHCGILAVVNPGELAVQGEQWFNVAKWGSSTRRQIMVGSFQRALEICNAVSLWSKPTG